MWTDTLGMSALSLVGALLILWPWPTVLAEYGAISYKATCNISTEFLATYNVLLWTSVYIYIYIYIYNIADKPGSKEACNRPKVSLDIGLCRRKRISWQLARNFPASSRALWWLWWSSYWPSAYPIPMPRTSRSSGRPWVRRSWRGPTSSSTEDRRLERSETEWCSSEDRTRRCVRCRQSSSPTTIMHTWWWLWAGCTNAQLTIWANVRATRPMMMRMMPSCARKLAALMLNEAKTSRPRPRPEP